jgi:hypothetical protein
MVQVFLAHADDAHGVAQVGLMIGCPIRAGFFQPLQSCGEITDELRWGLQCGCHVLTP